MAQLTLKILEQRIADIEVRLKEYSVFVNDRMDVLENPDVEEIIWTFNEDGESVPITIDEGPTVVLSAENQLEIVEALIEALRGVRLMRAGEYANALSAKYFPPEEVEEEEIVL